jgi:hypothetical protein
MSASYPVQPEQSAVLPGPVAGPSLHVELSKRSARHAAARTASATQTASAQTASLTANYTLVSGQLQAGDRRFSDNTYFDSYTFVARSSGTVQIGIATSGYAPYMEVKAVGSTRAFAYTSSGTNRATLTFNVTAGRRYELRAGSVYVVQGRYNLGFDSRLGDIRNSAGQTVGQPQGPTPPPTSGSGFKITLNYTTPISAEVRQAFEQAAARWSRIIIGDVPDVRLSDGRIVDDILLNVSVPDIDGAGKILGQAGPTGFRQGSFLPYMGRMQFDRADLANLLREGSLQNVIFHEMAHTLGHGTIWRQKGLLRGEGTANPLFIGRAATAEASRLFGRNLIGVPVEQDGGPGTANSHWDEETFGNEILTGYLNTGRNPLSRFSIASFQDLGYQVSYAEAGR